MAAFGTDPGISLIEQDKVSILFKARFHEGSSMCPCYGDASRRYIYVLENGFEQNYSFGFLCFPGNCCCPSKDFTYKTYFDRGMWDQQDICWASGCLRGAAYTHPGEVKLICCCTDCPEIINEISSCHFKSLCGDRVRYSPYETCLCGLCGTRASWCTNYCGLCGPKDGEPTTLCPMVDCLEQGSAEEFVEAMEKARASWMQRTGKK